MRKHQQKQQQQHELQRENTTKRQRKKERVGHVYEVDYQNIFVKCFEKYFERNCCLHQKNPVEQ